MECEERISVFEAIGGIWRRGDLCLGIILLLLVIFSPSMSSADDITLAWDQNSESDIAGYKIYYRTGSSGSLVTNNYDGGGIQEGNSPINLPANGDKNLDPRFVEIDLHGLDETQDYYFVVTAYNTSGLDSGPSNEAALLSTASTGGSPSQDSSGGADTARSVATGSSSSQAAASGSGGGGGCFISALGGR